MTTPPEAEAEAEAEVAPEPAPKPKPSRRRRALSLAHFVLVYLFGGALVVGAVAGWDYLRRDPTLNDSTVAQSPLTPEDEARLGEVLGRAWAGEAVEPERLPDRLREPGQPVYLSFRASGERLEHLWRTPESPGATMWDLVVDGLAVGRERLGPRVGEITHVEIVLSHSFRQIPYAKFDYKQKGVTRGKRPQAFYDYDEHGVASQFGVRGIQVSHGDRVRRYSPTWLLTKNRRVDSQLRQIQSSLKLSAEQMASEARIEVFDADQILLDVAEDPITATVMFRGNQIVWPEDVTQDSTRALVAGMASYLLDNIDEDGALTYHYYPSTATQDKSNNMIRQWMATNAMIRWGYEQQGPERQAVFDRVELNIDYNLENWFRYERDGEPVSFAAGETIPPDVLGIIEYRSRGVKLGALGLTGMALWLHPKRAKYRDQIEALLRTIDTLQNEDGSFDPFYGRTPSGDLTKYHNYYPGEAMLFWATIYAETKDPRLLAKFKRSFYYYRDFHLDPAVRNPAFVPWHLQADWAMWAALGDDERAFRDELAAFMFETADWLIEVMQDRQWEEYVHPDERGRFYSRVRGFGKPHASATGVYIEGIIDAWQLARALGREDLRERYRASLARAARSMMQLQFVDDVDMFYVTNPKAVRGGIRTTLYDDRIRCDNVQHPMMGLIKMVREFDASEYDTDNKYESIRPYRTPSLPWPRWAGASPP